MQAEVQKLVNEVAQARANFIAAVTGLSPSQAAFKLADEVWSITEITEHITRAEHSGVSGMWKALDGFRHATPVWSGNLVWDGQSIETVVEKTWQLKEQVPAIAAPIWGGSLGYWIASLRGLQSVLEELGEQLGTVRMEEVVYPHPISGPLNVRQRLEFLRFHLDRHRGQVETLKQHSNFPAAE